MSAPRSVSTRAGSALLVGSAMRAITRSGTPDRRPHRSPASHRPHRAHRREDVNATLRCARPAPQRPCEHPSTRTRCPSVSRRCRRRTGSGRAPRCRERLGPARRPGGPLRQDPELRIDVCRPHMRQDRPLASISRATCTATAPEAVRTFRTYATARNYPLSALNRALVSAKPQASESST